MSTYRMSTAGQHAAAVAQILRQQSALSRTQVQVASGLRVQTPADDPVAMTRILATQSAKAQLDQYGRNAGIVSDRLSLGEQSLADLGTLLQRMQELTVQANSGANDNVSLNSIATELKSRAQELLQIANRKDGFGEYLFSGYSTGTQPFSQSAGTVAYAGDQGVRQLQISSTQAIADGIHGQRLFMDIPEGNGTFVVTAGTHTGTGVVGVTQVTNAGAWARGNYTVSFSDPDGDGVANAWQATDDADTNVPPAVIASGTYVEGGAIAFNGAQFTLSGQPAAGDTFRLRPAGTESIFKTVDDLVVALGRGADTAEARAQLGTSVNKAMGQLDLDLNHVIDLRAEVGSRMAALDNAASLRDDLDSEMTGSLSKLRDLDYAAAISTLNQQMVGLQAAQAAYTRIGQMSLFDYLR
jgi:flagellar hook-associated protein 3 FlgL